MPPPHRPAASAGSPASSGTARIIRRGPGRQRDGTPRLPFYARRMATEASQGGGSVRVDAWIWAIRLVKTRSAGAAACRAGHVRVNGERAKPAQPVRVGDEVALRYGGRDRLVKVSAVLRKRVGAPVAVTAYVDNSPPPPPREAVAPAGVRDRGAGRPTKRDRREMERLRGLDG
ncbi:RNA-binding S4 domain-containing protein [Streptomyces albidoflavus]|uniref:RNA-binding S4 domain-containing protein n=1 Tax=Streptomyces albidoflavus TaxID=1886 RepID=UPI003BF47499